MAQRRKRSQAEKDYWKVLHALDKGHTLLERFCSSRAGAVEEGLLEELLQAANEIDELSYRLYSLRFQLQDCGAFEEEEDLEKRSRPPWEAED